MKKQDKNELEALFGNSQLQPDWKFDKQLVARINGTKQQERRLGIKLFGSAFAALLLVIGLAFMWPNQQQRDTLAQTVLLKDLFAQASAETLPEQMGITFWDITTYPESYGPAAAVCGVNTDRTGFVASHLLLFRKDAITAVYDRGGYPEATAYMRYSEDKEVPAFDDIDYFGKNTRGLADLIGSHPVFVDKSGNSLSDSTEIPRKTTGDYDVYVQKIISPDNNKEYTPGCSSLMIHVKIDAATNLYSEVTIYNGTATDDSMSWRRTRTITSQSGDFASVLPKFNKAGFDLEAAKETMSAYGSLGETNKAAGYQFSYNKAVFGKAAKKFDKGIYSYTYSRTPGVVHELRTDSAESSNPLTIADMKALAAHNNWKIVRDETPGSDYVANFQYGEPTQYTIELEGAGKRYILVVYVERYGSSISSVYVQAPIGMGVAQRYAPDMGEWIDNDYVLWLMGTVLYAPGEEPPEGL